LRLDPHPDVVVRLSAGLGFRAPSFQELLIRFENTGAGYVVVGNPNLRPETSQNLTASVEWRPTSRLWVSGNVFYNHIDDLITFGETADATVFTYVNVASARTSGAELSIAFSPLRGLHAELAYTLHATRDEVLDRPLEARPSDRISAGLRYRSARLGLHAQLRASWVGKRPYYEDGGTYFARPYTLVDARLAKRIGSHVELFAGADNLLNAGELRYNPIAPRSFYLGVTARY
ncbi:MAG: TonB-dependent receptor, partial [Deltaproteobacteria bacterium]